MGFKTFIKSKKILSLLAVLTLTGTHLVMAQDAAAPATAAATGDAADAAKSAMWTGVEYYLLLFL